MSNKNRSFVRSIVVALVTLVVLSAAGWSILNRQYIVDQLNVWQYEPTSAIATITDRSGMSDKGKFYFYASQPKIETAKGFNDNCTRQEANSAILGCYSAQKIYVYDVTNAELDGVEEVTASHETLHAIWDRMSDPEKQSVGTLLEAAYKKINDPKLNERMAYYQRTEPGERDNELHSILGTEYANLGTELETQYTKYFSNRAKVVALHDKYQSKFESLKVQSDALSAELASLKAIITTQSTQYNSEAASVTAAANELKQKYDTVDRTNSSEVRAYNAQRQKLINRIDALEALRLQINSETDSYNQKVVQYNLLVVSTNELNKSLDSTLAPAPSL